MSLFIYFYEEDEDYDDEEYEFSIVSGKNMRMTILMKGSGSTYPVSSQYRFVLGLL